MYPIVTGVRLPKPLRRVLYQFSGWVEQEEMTTQNRFDSAVELMWLWLQKKTGDMTVVAEVVEKNAKKNDLDISYNNSIRLRTATVLEEASVQWGMSFSHPDISVPTRVWETQAVLTMEDDRVHLFAELSYSASAEAEEATPSVPGFVRDIARSIGLRAAGPLRETPWTVETKEDVEGLYHLLTTPERNIPVVVLSEPDRYKWPLSGRAPEYIISGVELARAAFGRCYVVELPYLMSFQWSKRVSRMWSVFDGGVRIYQPGLNFDEDDIYTHTLFSKNKILKWKERWDERACQTFQQGLLELLTAKPVVLAAGQERRAFSGLYQKKLEQARQESTANEETIRKSYETQLETLREELKEIKALEEDSFAKYQGFSAECDRLEAEKHNLILLTESLREALKAGGKELKLEIPDGYDEMEEWCRQNFPDKLVFTSRARRAIKDDENLYSDVGLVYQCLGLLGNEYHDVKTGKGDGKALARRLEELQVENRPAATMTQAGMYPEEYFYTDDKKKKHLVEMHLAKGSGRDSRNTLRIYYYWDDEKEKVVIVSLTKHLTTSAS